MSKENYPPEAVETIVALATPAGRGGIGVVRISGIAAEIQRITQQILGFLPIPRHATYTKFLASKGNILDTGIALYFPAPHSFTGEDVLELQGHGGPIVSHMLIEELVALGARLARPGEFSERAFVNGKLDLAQAEAISDLINSSSRQAAQSALRTLQGEFSHKINKLVTALIQLRTYIEAAIDFPEEEIDWLDKNNVNEKLTLINHSIIEVLGQASQGVLLTEGITLVIAGEPNVGKSSLLNRLSGRDSAIVTDIPGTTRDLVRENIQLEGMPVHVLDTAGLRQSADPIEQEGIRRALIEIERADLLLLVVDRDIEQNMTPEAIWHKLTVNIGQKITYNGPIHVVLNKIDLKGENASLEKVAEHTVIKLSAKTGDGIDLLREHIKRHVGLTSTPESTLSARTRHLDALKKALNCTKNAQNQINQTAFTAWELCAEDLRQAQQMLSEITGAFTSDDLRGRIFADFCIGK